MVSMLLSGLQLASAAGMLHLGACLLTGPQVSAQPAHPAAAQPEAAPAPAHPEDVLSIDGIMKALYESTAGPAGQARDWDRLRAICDPNSTRFLAARETGNGGSTVFALTVEDYIMHNKRYFERGGFWDKEIARRTESFGNITHVWSTFESRRGTEDSDPYTRGVYSVQILKDGDRWWILSVLWDLEREDNPMPEKYLETPKED